MSDVGQSSGEKRINIVCDRCGKDLKDISRENLEQHWNGKGCKDAEQVRKNIHRAYKCDRCGTQLGNINEQRQPQQGDQMAVPETALLDMTYEDVQIMQPRDQQICGFCRSPSTATTCRVELGTGTQHSTKVDSACSHAHNDMRNVF